MSRFRVVVVLLAMLTLGVAGASAHSSRSISHRLDALRHRTINHRLDAYAHLPAAPSCSSLARLNRPQAERYLQHAELLGKTAIAALVSKVSECTQAKMRMHAAANGRASSSGAITPPPPPECACDIQIIQEVEMDANNYLVAQALAATVQDVYSSGYGPLPSDAGTLELDPLMAGDGADAANGAAQPGVDAGAGHMDQLGVNTLDGASSRGNTCTYPDYYSVDRIYVQGVHILSITKTLHGWCYNGQVVLSTSEWGHAVWVNPNHPTFCADDVTVSHGPDPSGGYVGNHSKWAEGGIWATLGFSNGGYGCVTTGDSRHHATIRIAGNGYDDTYDDYPEPYYGGTPCCGTPA